MALLSIIKIKFGVDLSAFGLYLKTMSTLPLSIGQITYIHDNNNHFDDNDIDQCLRNNEKDEGNEASFSLHDTLVDCLF